jgi:protein AroM
LKKLGVVTIGQAPRRDVSPILEKYIGDNVEIKQVGVLDGMTKEYIERSLYPEKGDYVLTTRLLSEDSVVLSREKIAPILQQKVNDLEERGYRQILLLCTGVFPGLYTKKAFLIEPDHVIPPSVSALVRDRKFGLIVPLAG